jgi:hypothetical protein
MFAHFRVPDARKIGLFLVSMSLSLSCAYSQKVTLTVKGFLSSAYGKTIYVSCNGDEASAVIGYTGAAISFSFKVDFDEDDSDNFSCTDDTEQAYDVRDDTPNTSTADLHVNILVDMDGDGVLTAGDRYYETKFTLSGDDRSKSFSYPLFYTKQ